MHRTEVFMMLDKVFKFAVIAGISLYFFRVLSGVCFTAGWWASGPAFTVTFCVLFTILGLPTLIVMAIQRFIKSRKKD